MRSSISVARHAIRRRRVHAKFNSGRVPGRQRRDADRHQRTRSRARVHCRRASRTALLDRQGERTIDAENWSSHQLDVDQGNNSITNTDSLEATQDSETLNLFDTITDTGEGIAAEREQTQSFSDIQRCDGFIERARSNLRGAAAS